VWSDVDGTAGMFNSHAKIATCVPNTNRNNLKKKNKLEDLVVDGKIILKLVLKEQYVAVWT
jgi:hypothetical protein